MSVKQPGKGNTELSGKFRKRRWYVYVIIGLLMLLAVWLATSIGSVKVPLSTSIGILLDRLPFIEITPNWPASMETIIIDIRLPRVLMAGLVGAALAIAGATYQGLFRNPLADPYLIGVAQGASLGAVIGFLLPVSWNLAGFGLIPVLAFAGALLATTTVYLLARVGKTLPVTTLILAGVALGALLSSIVSYLIISSGEAIHGIIFWLMGSFSLSQWSEVGIVLPYILVGATVIILFARMLNVMQLDEEQAQQLGVNVERLKIILLAAATLITAASVSFVGTIGFVGISSGIGFYLWLWALNHSTPTNVTVFLALSPVTATVLGALLLAERISTMSLLGLICVALGLWLAHRQAHLGGRRYDPR